MRELGSLRVVARNGLLIVKSSARNPERLVGAQVYDGRANKLGVVIDVIGRVDNPYVVVEPEDPGIVNELEIGSTLYYRSAGGARRRAHSGRSK